MVDAGLLLAYTLAAVFVLLIPGADSADRGQLWPATGPTSRWGEHGRGGAG